MSAFDRSRAREASRTRAVSGGLGRIDLRRRGAAEQIADELRERILTGDLRANAALREQEAADAFDVSRNTVREAFRILERDGLTVHEVHRGVTVKRLTPDDVRDLYRVRLLIQVEAVRQAEDLRRQRLRPAQDALQDAARARESGNWQDVLTCDVRFHQALVGLAGSPRLESIFAGLMTELRLGLSLLEDEATTSWHEANVHLCRVLEDDGVDAFAHELRAYLARSERALLTRLAADT
jgi:DNA-binding GntR family transcriptional regulator